VLLALVAAVLLPPAAHADGDPASDYLLFAPTFVPPDDGIPKAYADQLTATVRQAKARGYTIRVAVVGSRYDMGSVTVLYKKPKQYARFLGTELSLVYKQRLLIVMPNGLAVSRAGKALAREQAIVDRIAPPGTSGIALASTATKAVVKLAAAAGVVVQPAPLAATGRKPPNSTATRDRITIAAAALCAILVAGLFLYVRRRFEART
jgi:hypothetical protein